MLPQSGGLSTPGTLIKEFPHRHSKGPTSQVIVDHIDDTSNLNNFLLWGLGAYGCAVHHGEDPVVKQEAQLVIYRQQEVKKALGS